MFDNPEIDLDRLAHLLGMLGSRFDGEALNAGRLAHRLVRSAGSTWPEVLKRCTTSWESPRDTSEALMLCERWAYRLTDWERNFIASVQCRSRLSQRQERVIWDIADKIERLARAAP